MKKYVLSVLAIAIAFGSLAFTKSAAPLTVAGYWFPYNAVGTAVLDDTSQPPFTATDPFGCSGTRINCAQENSSYNQLSPTDFAPAGLILQTDRKN